MFLSDILMIFISAAANRSTAEECLDDVRSMPPWYIKDGVRIKKEYIDLSTAKMRNLSREELNETLRHLRQKNEFIRKDAEQMQTIGAIMIGLSVLTLLIAIFNPGSFPVVPISIFFGIVILLGGVFIAVARYNFRLYSIFDKSEISVCAFPVDALYSVIRSNGKGHIYVLQFAQCGSNHIQIANSMIERGGTNDELHCVLAEYKGKIYVSVGALV